MPEEKGPLAVADMPRMPPRPMASPRLRLLRPRPRPLRARRSSAALSLAFCSSWRARVSRSASSLRITFGLKRPTGAAARVALVVVAAAPRPAGVALRLGGATVAEAALDVVGSGLAAAGVERVCLADALPRFIMCD